jgi:hypothetical protein
MSADYRLNDPPSHDIVSFIQHNGLTRRDRPPGLIEHNLQPSVIKRTHARGCTMIFVSDLRRHPMPGTVYLIIFTLPATSLRPEVFLAAAHFIRGFHAITNAAPQYQVPLLADGEERIPCVIRDRLPSNSPATLHTLFEVRHTLLQEPFVVVVGNETDSNSSSRPADRAGQHVGLRQTDSESVRCSDSGEPPDAGTGPSVRRGRAIAPPAALAVTAYRGVVSGGIAPRPASFTE